MMVTSKENNEANADSQKHACSALTDLNGKLFDIMTDRGLLAS